MASNERIRKYLDAGSVLGQVTRGRAEEIVRELVNAGDIQRSQAQDWVDTMVERSKKTSENLLEVVRREVQAQLAKIDSAAIEDLANQVAEVLKKSAEAGRNAAGAAGSAAGGATRQATQAAKDATAEATKAARSATAGASRAAKSATGAAGKTANRAREAAEAAVPSRGKSKKSKDKGHKKDGHKDHKGHKDGHKKDKADPTVKAEKAADIDESVSETKSAPKKAS